MAPIRTAVVGYGLAGRVFHCPFVSAVPGLELTAIATSRREEAAARYAQARILATADEAISEPQVDLVVLATPNHTHAELASRALQAGKHVLIDKPFTTDSESARTLLELARRHGRVLAPFHNRRYDNDFLTVSRLIREGTLGRVTQIVSHYDRYRPLQRSNTWKEMEMGGGILFDLGPHLIDQALALFGSPQHITASVRRDRDQTDIDDAFDIVLHYGQPGGPQLIYECHATMLAAAPAPRFTVHGTHGSYVKHGLDPQEAALLAGALPPRLPESPEGAAAALQEGWLKENGATAGTLILAHERREPIQLHTERLPSVPGDYRSFYVQLRDAVLGDAPLAIPPQDGYGSVRLLELALESSRERRTLDVDLAL